jgi:hypothetical protein
MTNREGALLIRRGNRTRGIWLSSLAGEQTMRNVPFACLLAVIFIAQARGDDEEGMPKPHLVSNVPTLELKARYLFKTDDPPGSVSVSRDGKLVAANTGHYIEIWKTKTGEQVGRYSVQDNFMACAQLSPDGKVLACTDQRGEEIFLLDVASGKLLRKVGHHRHSIDHLRFSPDGKLLASATWQENVALWDVKTGQDVDRLPGTSDLREMAFAPDGKTLAVATDDGRIHVFNVARGERVRRFGPLHRQPCPRALVYSPDGRLLALGYWGKNLIGVWDPRNGRLMREHTWENDHERPEVARYAEELSLGIGTNSLVFTPDGRSLIAASHGMRVRVWETATGGLRAQVDEVLDSLAVGHGGSLFVGGIRLRHLGVWDAHRCLLPHRARVLPEAEKVWSGLADTDAATAYVLMTDLMRTPREAVGLLDKRLAGIPQLKPGDLDRLVGDLDADDFEARESASRRLAELGEMARPALKAALAKRPSAEVRRRIRDLLDPTEGECVRGLRALEVLEAIGTPEARSVLKRLAGGEPEASLTCEAKAALERMSSDK